MKFISISVFTAIFLTVTTQANACVRKGESPVLVGRVYIDEYTGKVGETCGVIFPKPINLESEHLEITDLSAPKEMNAKISKSKDGEPTISYTVPKEGVYDIDYYLQSIWIGHGAQGHWQRLRITAVK